MYRVVYYMTGNNVSSKDFKEFGEAIDFSNKLPINSVIEIKHYDDKTYNFQNESYNPR